MKTRGFTLVEVLIVVAIVGILAATIYGAIINKREWEAFRAAHNCKVVGKVESETNTGIGYAMSSGKGSGGPVFVTTTTPGKTGWVCDDGVTYWRND